MHRIKEAKHKGREEGKGRRKKYDNPASIATLDSMCITHFIIIIASICNTASIAVSCEAPSREAQAFVARG